MKSKLIYVAAGFTALCIIVGLVFAVMWRERFPSFGIEKIDHVDDLQDLDIRACAILQSDYVSYLGDAIYEENTEVLVVRPTGAFHQYSGSFSQEVEVISVEDGNSDLKEGEKIQVFRGFGIQYRDDEVYSKEIIYPNFENVMYPEYRYLIFVCPSELNQHISQKEYYVAKSCPAIINLDLEKPLAASEDFNSCRGLDVFCESQEVAEKVREYQLEMIKKYGL